MDYLDIVNSDYFKETYTIVEELKKDFPVNHGFIHVDHVINNAKRCAEVFKLTEKETKLLLIASALHDIGYLKGREDHAYSGSILAREFLDSSDLTNEEIDIICEAIKNHSGDEIKHFNNKVSLGLIMADKLDFVASRYNKDLYKEKNDVFYNILSTDVEFDDKTLTVKIKVSNKNIEEKFKEKNYYSKINERFKLASEFLGCDYKIEFTNKEEEKDK